MPSFSEKYFKRFQAFDKQIEEPPASDLQIIVVIPCSNEPNLNATLNSLNACKIKDFSAEIICVINSSEVAPNTLKQANKKTLEQAQRLVLGFKNPKLKFHLLLHENLKKKFAGVGLARKIGMDEAVRRFEKIANPKGIITGFDADSLTDVNYFTEIYKAFLASPRLNAASLYFEHPLSGAEYSAGIYKGITAYELHLRYFNQSLRRAGFPYAYHTVGSSFAVRANVYTAQGGMNRRKAGEDFYFLQKIIPLGNFCEINTVRIIPSPRTSDRVPFGTGAALAKMKVVNNFDFETYSFSAFSDLKVFFRNLPSLYTNDSLENFPTSIKKYLLDNNIHKKLAEIQRNSTDKQAFIKRFFAFFDAFRVIRFLNIYHESYYKKVPVLDAAKLFFQKYYPESEVLKQLLSETISKEEKSKIALIAFRKIENVNL